MNKKFPELFVRQSILNIKKNNQKKISKRKFIVSYDRERTKKCEDQKVHN